MTRCARQGFVVSDLSLECSIVGVDAATADELIGDLQEFLAHGLSGAKTQRVKDPETQDFGLTLAIVLGPPSVAALANVVSNWLQSRSDARLSLSRTDSKGKRRKIDVHGRLGKKEQEIIKNFLTDD
jgi:hypothetical protein